VNWTRPNLGKNRRKRRRRKKRIRGVIFILKWLEILFAAEMLAKESNF